MNEAEYREFLGFLFERYVRPRLARVRERHFDHFGWGVVLLSKPGCALRTHGSIH